MDIVFVILGFFVGRFIKPPRYLNALFFLLLLLFILLTAMNAAEGFLAYQQPYKSTIKIVSLAFGSTAFIFLFCYWLFPRVRKEQNSHSPLLPYVIRLGAIYAVTFSTFAIGFFLAKQQYFSNELLEAGLNIFLYSILFTIGIIISQNNISAIRPGDLALPAVIVVANTLFSLLVTPFWSDAIVLLSGLGWGSLSSAIITKSIGSTLGAEALLVDIFRGLFSLAFIVLCGRTLPQASIASSGVLSCDAFLPLVESNCGKRYVPLAFTSGLLLSFISPFYIHLTIYFAKQLI